VDMQHVQDMKMKRDDLGFQKDKEFTRLDVEGREDEQDATQIKRLVEIKKDMKAHAVDQDIKRFQGIDLEAKKTDSMTALELARIEAEKAKALAAAEADKARYSMDTFTRAEDRERAHQYQMTGLSSNMMQASKQNVPQTLVQGGGFTSTSVGGPKPADEDTTMCPNCGEKVRKGKVCLSCGAKLGGGGPGGHPVPELRGAHPLPDGALPKVPDGPGKARGPGRGTGHDQLPQLRRADNHADGPLPAVPDSPGLQAPRDDG
jgi:hypothetical protein